jgi:cobalamin biosynthesis protein CobD/CbiB
MLTRFALLACCPLGLPDLDKLRELLRRVQEILAMGGVALASLASLAFVLAWAVSHVRHPSPKKARPILSTVALVSAWPPVALTIVAAAGIFVPFLAPFILKSFALAVLLAGVSWVLAIATLIAGGSKGDLARARKALLLAGTPWYCLALYLATYL